MHRNMNIFHFMYLTWFTLQYRMSHLQDQSSCSYLIIVNCRILYHISIIPPDEEPPTVPYPYEKNEYALNTFLSE